MRFAFGKTIHKISSKDKKVVVLTGDLGHGVFEELAETVGPRFINAGVAEHNMVTVASGLAYTGLQSWIYSVAPFVTIKILEELRNDVALLNADVKIVGLGGGYDYAIAGPTHHALQDVAVMLSLPNVRIFAPAVDKDLEPIIKKMHKRHGPDYLRLTKAEKVPIAVPDYKPLRKLTDGKNITVVVLGSLIKDVVPALLPNLTSHKIDLWVVCELPFKPDKNLLTSINKTKNICIIEEHVRLGALGSYMSQFFMENGIRLNRFTHLYAKGYPSKRYGSRNFYLKQSGLDRESIARSIKKLL